MSTLLNLFFIPYVRFLVKFHLIVIAVVALIIVSKMQEIMMLAPMLYMFGLYATSNRHQFKDNISWMLASFNKKTLIQYHVTSQTLILLMQLFLVTIFSVGFISLVIFLTPELSSKILPDSGSMMSAGIAQKFIEKSATSILPVKDTLFVWIAFIFFLITMYSPISMKDYLRQVEQAGKDKASTLKFVYTWGLFVFASFLILDFEGSGLDSFLIPILSFIIVGEVFYLLHIYNKVFLIAHPNKQKMGAVVGVLIAVGVSFSVYQKSLHRFYNSSDSDLRLSELSFLGAFAPDVSESLLREIVLNVKDPSTVVSLIDKPLYKSVLKDEILIPLLLKSNDLSVAMQLISAIPADQKASVNKSEVWSHLNTLLVDLYKANPASATWQVNSFQRQILKSGWTPSEGSDLTGKTALEQLLIIGWSKENSEVAYKELINQDLDPMTQSLLIKKSRAPASSR
jgi:hypothetical protein